MMKRSRAFVLVELLTTMLLQAGFILVLCASFYLLASFYNKSQQMLTARDHADRVLLFFDDKMIHTGLGLWKLTTPAQIRNALGNLANGSGKLNGLRLPVAVREMTRNNPDSTTEKGLRYNKRYGDIVTLLYAERDISSGGDGNILVTGDTALTNTNNITLLDTVNGRRNYTNSEFYNTIEHNNKSPEDLNISNWAVMESAGVPFFIEDTNLSAQGWSSAVGQKIPEGGELLYLRCIQMFTRDVTDAGRQFAFRELGNSSTNWRATAWSDKYNQEEGVLEIYMELDTDTNIFTLWVMGTGGFDMTINNPRPANWPENAHPTQAEWTNTTGTYKDYKHNIVYVSRASWKLNNIPDGFDWTR